MFRLNGINLMSLYTEEDKFTDEKIKQEVLVERELAALLTIAAAHIYCFLPEGEIQVCVKDFQLNVNRVAYVPFVYKKMNIKVF